MNAKLRNTVVAAVVLLLVSIALARNDSVIYLDYGAPWVSSLAQQEVLLVSATPVFIGAGAGGQAVQASEQQFKRGLEALGIWVD
jgi:hypothetical protein